MACTHDFAWDSIKQFIGKVYDLDRIHVVFLFRSHRGVLSEALKHFVKVEKVDEQDVFLFNS